MLLMSIACDAIALGSNQVEVEVEVFTPDMEEPIRVVKQFDSTLKYALFTFGIVWDIDVGMNNIDKAAQ